MSGFKEAEAKFGLRHTKFLDDGDSSLHPSLITEVLIWGHMISKVECTKFHEKKKKRPRKEEEKTQKAEARKRKREERERKKEGREE